MGEHALACTSQTSASYRRCTSQTSASYRRSVRTFSICACLSGERNLEAHLRALAENHVPGPRKVRPRSALSRRAQSMSKSTHAFPAHMRLLSVRNLGAHLGACIKEHVPEHRGVLVSQMSASHSQECVHIPNTRAPLRHMHS